MSQRGKKKRAARCSSGPLPKGLRAENVHTRERTQVFRLLVPHVVNQDPMFFISIALVGLDAEVKRAVKVYSEIIKENGL